MQVLSRLIFQCSLLLYWFQEAIALLTNRSCLLLAKQWIPAPWKLQKGRWPVSHERFCFCFSVGGGQNQKLMCLSWLQPQSKLRSGWFLRGCSVLCCLHGCALRHAPSWTYLQLYQKTRSRGPEGNCHWPVKLVVTLLGPSFSTISLSGNIHGPFDDSLLKLGISGRTNAPFYDGNT